MFEVEFVFEFYEDVVMERGFLVGDFFFGVIEDVFYFLFFVLMFKFVLVNLWLSFGV